jgi:hypothetical protein
MKPQTLEFGSIKFVWSPDAGEDAPTELERHYKSNHPLSLSFFEDKGQHLWVLSSRATIGLHGPYEDAPPVRLIQHDDKEKLTATLLALLEEKVPIKKAPTSSQLALRPAAVNAKTNLTYFNRARCFMLEKKEDHYLIEEWPRAWRYWTANACWRRKFPLDQFDKLVASLIRRTKPEVMPKPKKAIPKKGAKKVASRSPKR